MWVRLELFSKYPVGHGGTADGVLAWLSIRVVSRTKSVIIPDVVLSGGSPGHGITATRYNQCHLDVNPASKDILSDTNNGNISHDAE